MPAVRTVRQAGSAAVLCALVAFACVGASASAAGPRASSAAPATVYLRVGDQVYVKGSPVACVVQRSSGTINMVCVKGSPSSPTPGGYGIGIADTGTEVVAVSANSAKLVKGVREPAVSGAKFATPAGKARAYTLAPPAALLVGGTHIFCAVEKASGALPINVTCGLSSLAAALQYPPGSYITSESGRFALLAQAEPKRAFKTITLKAQP